jgi:prolyl 4-hydroxylase
MKLTIGLFIIIAILLIIYLCIDVERSYRGFCNSSDPWETPITVENIITPEECQHIIELATPKFARSGIVGRSAPDDIRTSETAWIYEDDDPVVQKIIAKACELTGKTLDHCEKIQVVRYTPGAYYRPHHDSCCDPDPACLEFENNGGQRVGTLLIYLNNDFENGETEFPNLKSKFRAPPGTGVFFRPMDKSGKQCHPLALHGGMPPTNGTKYACNVWVRELKHI